MLWPLLRTPRGRVAAALGAAICLATIPFVPLGVPLLCATLGIAVGVPAEAPRRVTSEPLTTVERGS
jgi:hypothetical protein